MKESDLALFFYIENFYFLFFGTRMYVCGWSRNTLPESRWISSSNLYTEHNAQHSDILAMCCTSNIIFCDICCSSSATLLLSNKLLTFFHWLRETLLYVCSIPISHWLASRSALHSNSRPYLLISRSSLRPGPHCGTFVLHMPWRGPPNSRLWSRQC